MSCYHIGVRMINNYCLILLDTVRPEILAGFKFGGLVLNSRNKNIGGFKFGGYSRLQTLLQYARTRKFNTHTYVQSTCISLFA